MFFINLIKSLDMKEIITTKAVAITILGALLVAFLLNVVVKSLYALASRDQKSYNGILESRKEEDGVEIQCVVCLCKFCEGEKYWLLRKCSHGFHVECINSWLNENSSCPTCRNPIQYDRVKLQSQCCINVFVFHFLASWKYLCSWCLDLVSQPIGDGHYFVD